jgi:hypothetical protein
MTGYPVSGGTGSSRWRIGLSQGISCTPNSEEALFRPNGFCILTWLSRKDGLCEKNTAKADRAASSLS